MDTGVSYCSSRTLRHVRADLQDIVNHGCTYVVHCFTETDLAYYRETMREVVQETREAGLEVWLDPWGLCGVFSGETFTRFPLDHPETWQVLSDGRRVGVACPNNPGTRAFLRGWVDACATIGGDVLFWDEPHFYVAFSRATYPAPGPAAAKSASASFAIVTGTRCQPSSRRTCAPSARRRCSTC